MTRIHMTGIDLADAKFVVQCFITDAIEPLSTATRPPALDMVEDWDGFVRLYEDIFRWYSGEGEIEQNEELMHSPHAIDKFFENTDREAGHSPARIRTAMLGNRPPMHPQSRQNEKDLGGYLRARSYSAPISGLEDATEGDDHEKWHRGVRQVTVNRNDATGVKVMDSNWNKYCATQKNAGFPIPKRPKSHFTLVSATADGRPNIDARPLNLLEPLKPQLEFPYFVALIVNDNTR
eukprot:gene19747-997_t